MIFRKMLLPILVLSIIACEFSEDLRVDDNVATGYPDVDQALWPYFDRFAAEAQKHGYLDMPQTLLGLTGAIDNISDEGVAGTCHYASHRPNHVTIDKSFWNRSSDLGREFVVFHELGHCALLRAHLDACTQDRIYTSLMRSGHGDCRDAYNVDNRDYYLNELYSISGDWFKP